jgi:adenine-specific DNA-methyltransferase
VSGEEVWPPRSSVWRYSKERHDQNVADGLVWWGKTGNYRLPKIKRFRSSVADTAVPRTLWRADEVDQTRRAKQHSQSLFPERPAFATPKPERLIERVLHIGSEAGDIVLDCFAGSGTTAAVAHKMGRRWVTAEVAPETVEAYTRPRLELVVKGEDPGGITEGVGWKGGGGFRSWGGSCLRCRRRRWRRMWTRRSVDASVSSLKTSARYLLAQRAEISRIDPSFRCLRPGRDDKGLRSELRGSPFF